MFSLQKGSEDIIVFVRKLLLISLLSRVHVMKVSSLLYMKSVVMAQLVIVGGLGHKSVIV